MDATQSITGNASSKQHLWAREQISQRINQIRLEQRLGASLNQSASGNGVVRSTAQIWMRNRARLEQVSGLNPTLVESFRVTPRARVPKSTFIRFPSCIWSRERWRYPQYLLAA